MKTAHAITHLCELTTEQLHHLMKTIDVDIRTAECSGAEIVAEVQMVFLGNYIVRNPCIWEAQIHEINKRVLID